MTPYSETGLRELSRFHAEEMVYDFCVDNLDPIRHQIVWRAIQADENLVEEVQRIRKALEYCGELSHWPVSLKEGAAVQSSSRSWVESFIERTRFQQWPAGLRLGLESLFVVSAIFGVALLLPWNAVLDQMRSEKGSLTLTEMRRNIHSGMANSEFEPNVNVVYEDEGIPASVIEEISKPEAEKMGLVPQISPPAPPAPLRPEVAQANLNPTPARDLSSIKEPPPSGQSAEGTWAVALKAPPQGPKKGKEKSSDTTKETAGTLPGVLYRGTLVVTNVEATTPKLVSFISDLGGRKAGKVPIGWQKDSGSYFHFTIPEAKYDELEKFFRDYGKLELNKETHTRVMPKGVIRLIIEVNEKKSAG
ncbi:MAG: hypothetical protein C5B49_07065 [Bdellovibrio sp.]|nr:MAG: hypothetical protein C5B49_07065 [Bdellovibrio sp.]